MINHIFFLILPSILKAFVPPLDGVNDHIDVQNNLADSGDVLGIEPELKVNQYTQDYYEYKDDV